MKRQLSEEEKIKIRLLNDEMLFMQYILPHHFFKETPTMHVEVVEMLQEGHELNAIVAPRKHAKTTVISLGHVLYNILFVKKHFIVIISNTDTIARQLVDDIRNELDNNERILKLWGHLEGPHWGEKALETNTQIMVLPRGSGQQVRGLKYRQWRPDLIILDDIEDKENTATRESRQKLSEWFNGEVLFATGDSDKEGNKSQVVFTGTILHYASLLSQVSDAAARFTSDESLTLRKEEEKKQQEDINAILGEEGDSYKFHTLFYSVEQNGQPLWPEKFSMLRINALKEYYRKIGQLPTFYREFYNNPTFAGNRPFKRSQFLYFSLNGDHIICVDRDNKAHFIPYSSTNRFILVDPAISEKDEACDTAIVAIALDYEGRLFVLEYIAAKLTPGGQIDGMFRMQSKYEALAVGIESVAYQKSLKYFTEEEQRRRGYFFPVDSLKPDTDKVRRIMRLQPRYEAGTIYHKRGMDELEEQLVLMPKPPLLDILDALAYGPELGYKPAKPKEAVEVFNYSSMAQDEKYMDLYFKRNLERLSNPPQRWSSN